MLAQLSRFFSLANPFSLSISTQQSCPTHEAFVPAPACVGRLCSHTEAVQTSCLHRVYQDPSVDVLPHNMNSVWAPQPQCVGSECQPAVHLSMSCHWCPAGNTSPLCACLYPYGTATYDPTVYFLLTPDSGVRSNTVLPAVLSCYLFYTVEVLMWFSNYMPTCLCPGVGLLVFSAGPELRALNT